MDVTAETHFGVASSQGELPTTASIILIGTSFKTASIDLRERIVARLLGGGKLKIPLYRMGILEGSIIETCNRVELYLVTNDPENTVKSVLSKLDVGNSSVGKFYVKIGLDAIEHIFRVSSGLDSLVVGEEQILQQVRDAGISARVSGKARSILSSLFDTAYNVGRRARELYEVPSSNKSVSAFALKYALRQLGRRPKRVLLTGTGETAKLAALELKGAKIYLLSRRRDTNVGIPNAVRIPTKQLKRVAADCDLIITATRRPGYVLKKGDIPDDRKKVILDLAFPRNVDPAMRSSNFIRLYDLDDLAAQARSLPRNENYAASEKLIDAEAETFNRWMMASRLTPTLATIYRWAEDIRAEETKLALRRLSQLSERERRIVEVMSRRLVSKLMAPHASFVKEQEGSLSQVERLRLLDSVFGKEAGN